MPIIRKTISIYLPQWLYRPLRRVKRALLGNKNEDKNSGINLLGSRDVEYSFIATQMPCGPGEALDFGSGDGYMSLIAALQVFKVMAVDLEPQAFSWRHPRVRFIQGDLLKLALPQNHFDLIINCSAVEHVGLVGRYGVAEERPNGDLEAMEHLRPLMKPGSIMLLTIPVGQDAVFAPLHRVYGTQRLPRLLECYKVVHHEFWIKDSENRWVLCEKETALQFKAFVKSSRSSEFADAPQYLCAYALGCFVLRAL